MQIGSLVDFSELLGFAAIYRPERPTLPCLPFAPARIDR